jgi:hypothetical protein
VSGLMNPQVIPHKLVQSYGPIFLFGALCLIVVSIAVDINPKRTGSLPYAKWMSSMYTANLIRTSHHTGTSTDIGLIVEQMLCGNWKNCWKYKVLVGLVSLFRCGGLVSFYAVTALKKFLWFSAWYYSWGFHNTCHIFVMLSQKWELGERFWSLSLSTLYMV